MAKKKKRSGPSRPHNQQRPAAGRNPNRSSDAKREAALARRAAAAELRAKARRAKKRRNIIMIALIVVLVVALIGWQVQRNVAKQARYAKIAAAAGCTDVRRTSTSGGGEHLQPGQKTTYDTSPPTHGAHDASTLRAGVYNDPLTDAASPGANSIYKAVHSLEHGYVIVWHNGLSPAELTALTEKLRGEKKVIVAPYPQLAKGRKLAFTSWGRIQTCAKPDPRAAQSFVDRFRESKEAPEPVNV